MAVLTTVMDLLGLILVVFGVFLVSIPAAIVVGGLGLIAVSWALSGKAVTDEPV